MVVLWSFIDGTFSVLTSSERIVTWHKPDLARGGSIAGAPRLYGAYSGTA